MTKLNQSNLQRDKSASISSLIELCGEMNPIFTYGCCLLHKPWCKSYLCSFTSAPRALQKASIMTKRGHNR